MKIWFQLYKVLFIALLISLTSCGGDSKEDTPLVAAAGVDVVTTLLAGSFQLDGSSNSADDISYLWQIESMPKGSTAYLMNELSSSPILYRIDLSGVYEILLTVTDDEDNSDSDSISIFVQPFARNIILMIGDGMGFEQIKAAGLYENGVSGTLFFEDFPFQGEVTTINADNEITDSAAAGTAMATGNKVENSVISQQIPGDGSDLESILEVSKEIGSSTGLVTTTIISHATPATFGAHVPDRSSYEDIITNYLYDSKPDLLLGGAQYITPADAQTEGYTVVEDYNDLVAVDIDSHALVWGQFGETHLPYELDGLGDLPHLTESTEFGLSFLENDSDGFFLMIEGGRIDHAGHSNDIQRSIYEIIEFSNAVEAVYSWAEDRTDTLIIVTADHETGGLEVVKNNGAGNFPDVSWSTTGHTAKNVPVFSWGINSHLFDGTIDNTDIFTFMHNSILGTSTEP